MLKPAVLLFILAFALALHAQERPLSISVHSGATLATIDLEWEAFEPKFRTGFFVGADLRLAVAEHWGLPVELRYSQRGFRYDTPGAFVIQDNQLALYRGRVDHRATYLDIVPQIEFRPIRHFSIAAGPYLSTRLGEAVRYGEVIDWTSTKDDAIFDDMDLGLSAKLSGHFGHATVFAAYQHGLTDMASQPLVDANGQSLGRVAAKNRAVLVGAGWQF